MFKRTRSRSNACLPNTSLVSHGSYVTSLSSVMGLTSLVCHDSYVISLIISFGGDNNGVYKQLFIKTVTSLFKVV